MSRTVAGLGHRQLAPLLTEQRQDLREYGPRPVRVAGVDDHETGGGQRLHAMAGRQALAVGHALPGRGSRAGGRDDRGPAGPERGGGVPGALRSGSAGQAAWFVVEQATMDKKRFSVTLRRLDTVAGAVAGRMGRAHVQAGVVGGR